MRELRMKKDLSNWGASVLKKYIQKSTKRNIFFWGLVMVQFAGFGQISLRELEDYNSSSDAFTYTSGSYTPRAGSLLLAVVSNTSGTSSNANATAAPNSVSGNGLTWTLVQSLLFNSNGIRTSVYRATTGTSTTNGAFTVNFPGSGTAQQRKSCNIQVIEVLGAELTGTNGSEAITSIVTKTGSGTTATASVSTLDVAGTTVLGIFTANQQNYNPTAETGWTILSEEGTNNNNVSTAITFAVNTYDESVTVTRSSNAQWGAIVMKLVPAEYYFNVGCASTANASNNQNFNLNAAGLTCRNGNASNLSLSANNVAATFVAKSNTFTFSAVSINNGATLVVDQSATVNFSNNTDVNSQSNLFVANGGTLNVNGNLTLNSGYLRVYGNATINGNLTVNSAGKIFVGTTGSLTVTGTLTINTGIALVNGGESETRTLVTRSGSAIELAQGGTLESTIYNENNQLNVLVMGPGAGCFGMVGSSGSLNTLNNGFQPITADNSLKVCIPSSGVTVGSAFNSTNKGSAAVTNGCGGCSFLLGNATLPITLNRFDGSMLSNGMSQLVWEVANNNEVARFTLEYSSNGIAFEPIATLSKGSSTAYQSQHRSSHSGLIFYRLLMTDKNGKNNYSRTISLLNGKQQNSRIIAVVPTVISSMVRVDMYAAKGQSVTYSIVDATGRMLLQNKQVVQQGMTQLKIDVNNLPKGNVYLQIQTQDGQRMVQKLMKM